MHIIFGIFLIAHGVAHLVGFVTYWKIASFEEMPYKTTLLADRVDVGDVGIRIVGVLWLLIGLAFAVLGVGLIALNRPERLNAINLEMLEDLHTLFEDLKDREEVRVVIITGEGRGFCSGADLMDERIHKEAATLFASAAAHLMNIQKIYSSVLHSSTC